MLLGLVLETSLRLFLLVTYVCCLPCLHLGRLLGCLILQLKNKTSSTQQTTELTQFSSKKHKLYSKKREGRTPSSRSFTNNKPSNYFVCPSIHEKENSKRIRYIFLATIYSRSTVSFIRATLSELDKHKMEFDSDVINLNDLSRRR